MIRAKTSGRSTRGGRRAFGVLERLVLAGLLAAVGTAGRALAFQSPGGSRSVLGPGSASKPAKAAPAADRARPGSGGEKAKLTPQEARELAQALRQLQAAVHADRQAGRRRSRSRCSGPRGRSRPRP